MACPLAPLLTLIALDIDGVLNSHEWLSCAEYRALRREFRERYAAGDPDRGKLHDLTHLCPANVGVLNKLAQETNAAILIISSGFRYRPLDHLRAVLKERGLQAPIIGKVRNLDRKKVNWEGTEPSKIVKGLEIETWILERYSREDLPKLRLVILDDESDFGRLLPWRVQPSLYKNGLQPEHAEQAKRVLAGPSPGPILQEPNPLWF